MSLDDGATTDTPATDESPDSAVSSNDSPPAPRPTRTTAAQRIAEGEAVIGGRDRLYRQHIFSAHHFSELAHVLEGRGSEDLSAEEKWRHRAYVIGAAFSASSFLEASINELYLELQNLSQSGHPRLPPRELGLLLRVWPDVVGSPVLHKYQVALSISDADNYDESRPPYIDADSLLRLRDGLLSCTPDWDDSRGKHRTLEKRLRTKFPPSSLAPASAPWFPDRCLGAGCAKWAVRTAQAFSDDFCRRMGIPARARVGREGAV
jgi:hypothetical protein